MNNTTHGVQMDRWMPSRSGVDFKLNVITKSLEPYKKYVTSFGNIKNDAVAATQHTYNSPTWLSGSIVSIRSEAIDALNYLYVTRIRVTRTPIRSSAAAEPEKTGSLSSWRCCQRACRSPSASDWDLPVAGG